MGMPERSLIIGSRLGKLYPTFPPQIKQVELFGKGACSLGWPITLKMHRLERQINRCQPSFPMSVDLLQPPLQDPPTMRMLSILPQPNRSIFLGDVLSEAAFP